MFQITYTSVFSSPNAFTIWTYSSSTNLLVKHIIIRYRSYICCDIHLSSRLCHRFFRIGDSRPDITSYTIYVCVKINRITCKCICSYKLCASIYIFFMNTYNPVLIINVTLFWKLPCIIQTCIISPRKLRLL